MSRISVCRSPSSKTTGNGTMNGSTKMVETIGISGIHHLIERGDQDAKNGGT